MTDLGFLDNLNPSQRTAVEYVDGPSLVIAGAGSGKTMVLTYKIAYLLKLGFKPYTILALTFTNKAAREMKERVAQLVNIYEASSLRMGTFHSIFNRILRREAGAIGFSPNYTIYQPSDSRSLVKSIVKEMGLDDKVYKPQVICNRISEAKNALVFPNEYLESQEIRRHDSSANIPHAGEVYMAYFHRCHQANAMDFDDLLLYTYFLFEKYPEICSHYAHLFQFVLVDEYQDTNYAQHKILGQLTSVNKKICVVGDDAQSIYSFRGAKIENILRFTQEYENARLFKLELNYRSTQNIVGAANSLIKRNQRQIPKSIYSENEKGRPLLLRRAYSDVEEAEIVCNEIQKSCRYGNISYSQVAVLYRTNAQSRIFEESLRKHGIPYRIYGGFSFYDQKVIKDVLAYFRLIVNPNDEEAFKRIVNYPTRGLGDITIGKVLAAASENNVSVWEVMGNLATYNLQVNAGTLKKLESFYHLISSFSQQQVDAYELGQLVLKESGIMAEAYRDNSVEGKEMRDNLSELLNGMNSFVEMQRETGDEERISLSDYLSEVALLSDTDDPKTENKDMVTLMTVHASKGLEFDMVFMVGMEEELFPNMQTLYSQQELEEERRLFYVAITRAKKQCFLSCAKSRFRFGKVEFFQPSRFLTEIDRQYLQDDKPVASAVPFDSKPKASQPNKWQELFASRPAEKPMRRVVASNHGSEEEEPRLDSVLINGMRCTVGSRVEHAKFGIGEVVELCGPADACKATVRFQNVGEKKLLLKYAKLTVL